MDRKQRLTGLKAGKPDAALKKKVYESFRNGYFKGRDDLVDVSDGYGDFIHVVIVSRKFDGKDFNEKRDLIWQEIKKHLSPKEWKQITLEICCSPEDLKAL